MSRTVAAGHIVIGSETGYNERAVFVVVGSVKFVC